MDLASGNLERFNKLICGEKIDRVPFFTNATIYSGVLGKLKSVDFYLNPQKSYLIQKKALKVHGCDGSPSFDYPGYTGILFGGSVEYRDDPYVGIPSLNPVMRSKSDIEKLRDTSLNWSYMELELNFLKLLHDDGGKIPISLGSPLEVVSNICETGLMLRLFRRDKVLLRELLEVATDYIKKKGDFLIEEFGIENCYCTGNFPIESILSPKMVEEYTCNCFMEVFEYFKSKGITFFSMHLCGDHNKNLEIFRDMGLPERTFFSLDEKVSLERASSTLGDKYIIGGNLASSILLSGSVNEVFESSRDILLKNKGRYGGFVFMPSCTLPPKTPQENVFAMHEACEIYGRY